MAIGSPKNPRLRDTPVTSAAGVTVTSVLTARFGRPARQTFIGTFAPDTSEKRPTLSNFLPHLARNHKQDFFKVLFKKRRKVGKHANVIP